MLLKHWGNSEKEIFCIFEYAKLPSKCTHSPGGNKKQQDKFVKWLSHAKAILHLSKIVAKAPFRVNLPGALLHKGEYTRLLPR